MLILAAIWSVSEYHNAGGWPSQGFSQSSGIHDVWNIWIIYRAIAWAFLTAAFGSDVYLRKPILESRIEREIERQAQLVHRRPLTDGPGAARLRGRARRAWPALVSRRLRRGGAGPKSVAARRLRTHDPRLPGEDRSTARLTGRGGLVVFTAPPGRPVRRGPVLAGGAGKYAAVTPCVPCFRGMNPTHLPSHGPVRPSFRGRRRTLPSEVIQMDASADRFLDLINQLEDFTRSVSPDQAHSDFDEIHSSCSGCGGRSCQPRPGRCGGCCPRSSLGCPPCTTPSCSSSAKAAENMAAGPLRSATCNGWVVFTTPDSPMSQAAAEMMRERAGFGPGQAGSSPGTTSAARAVPGHNPRVPEVSRDLCSPGSGLSPASAGPVSVLTKFRGT